MWYGEGRSEKGRTTPTVQCKMKDAINGTRSDARIMTSAVQQIMTAMYNLLRQEFFEPLNIFLPLGRIRIAPDVGLEYPRGRDIIQGCMV